MTTPETSPARKLPQAYSRHLRVDTRFARLLAEDFGFAAGVTLDALVGGPQEGIVLYSCTSQQDDPKSVLLCWARKHRKGRCRRARRAPGGPSRRHEETPPGRSVDTEGRGRGSGPTCSEDSLRGALVDPAC